MPAPVITSIDQRFMDPANGGGQSVIFRGSNMNGANPIMFLSHAGQPDLVGTVTDPGDGSYIEAEFDPSAVVLDLSPFDARLTTDDGDADPLVGVMDINNRGLTGIDPATSPRGSIIPVTIYGHGLTDTHFFGNDSYTLEFDRRSITAFFISVDPSQMSLTAQFDITSELPRVWDLRWAFYPLIFPLVPVQKGFLPGAFLITYSGPVAQAFFRNVR